MVFDPFSQNGLGPAETISITRKELDELPKHYPDKSWVIALMMVPGVIALIQEIEHTFYVPDTVENEKFGLILSKWPGDSEHIVDIVSTIAFPTEDMPKVQELSELRGFRFKPNVGLLAFHEGEEHWFGFPQGYNNVYCLCGVGKDE